MLIPSEIGHYSVKDSWPTMLLTSWPCGFGSCCQIMKYPVLILIVTWMTHDLPVLCALPIDSRLGYLSTLWKSNNSFFFLTLVICYMLIKYTRTLFHLGSKIKFWPSAGHKCHNCPTLLRSINSSFTEISMDFFCCQKCVIQAIIRHACRFPSSGISKVLASRS